jgi:NADH-quinone oxidoreductase subunit L
MTHAFFKALLFLAAGSVIIAMHHEQDMRKMGGLAKYLPVTYFTFVIGSLALCAIPPFSGFFSKDMVIDVVHHSTLPGAHYAYWCVLLGAFVTPLYTFRALFMTFHTKERMNVEMQRHLHESSWVILLPLILLAIPSLIAGQILIGPMLFANQTILGNTVFVLPQHNTMTEIAANFQGANWMALKAGGTLTFWLSIAGIFTAWLFFVCKPNWSEKFKKAFSWLYNLLTNKYGFDDFNQLVLVRGTRNAGEAFYQVSDVKVIDDTLVNGSGKFVTWLAQKVRYVQTGYLYQYALVMILGMLGFLLWYVGGF